MRYEVRWGNGIWMTFDTLHYAPVEPHYTRSEAERCVGLANDWDAKG